MGEFDMTTPMKCAALQTKLGELEGPEIEGFQPDISPKVEAICCAFNSRILRAISWVYCEPKSSIKILSCLSWDIRCILVYKDAIKMAGLISSKSLVVRNK